MVSEPVKNGLGQDKKRPRIAWDEVGWHEVWVFDVDFLGFTAPTPSSVAGGERISRKFWGALAVQEAWRLRMGMRSGAWSW